MTQPLEKPAIGAPCNGCGLCCRAQICSLGSFTLGLVEAYGDRAPGPCPALLEQEEGGVTCGMVERPREHAPGQGGAQDLRRAAKTLIGIGAGCDEAGPDESRSDLVKMQNDYVASVGRGAINRAFAVWFGLKKENS